MANIERNKKNWEAEFANITYEQAKEMENDKNIKEVSIYKKLGLSEPIFQLASISISLDIRAYDSNSLKNAKLVLEEGRLP